MSATVFYEHAAELVTLSNTFAVDGTPTDPTTVSLVVTDPDGTPTTHTYAATQITRTGTGAYTKDISCTIDGIWTYAWIGTGAASDVQAGTWTVVSTELGKLYCSVEELKSRLRISDTADDFELRLATESASRWIDRHCGRYFWRATATRTFTPDGLYCLDVGDLVSVTTLKTDGDGDGVYETTWAAGDYQLQPVDPTAGGETEPYTSLRWTGGKTFPYPTGVGRTDRVQIVGVFGWPAVPAAVKQAALISAADLFKLKDAPFGVQGFGDFAMRVRENTRATSLLAPYCRRPVLMA